MISENGTEILADPAIEWFFTVEAIYAFTDFFFEFYRSVLVGN